MAVIEWLDWFSEACWSLPTLLFGTDPEPGSQLHHDFKMSARREWDKEKSKPAEQRDPERVRQLRIRSLELDIEDGQYEAAAHERVSREWLRTASQAACCKGSSFRAAHRRIAASFAARARFFRSEVLQAQEELSALLERLPMDIVDLPRIELPVAVLKEMKEVKAIDVCAECYKQLKEAESDEELLRKQGQVVAEYYRSLVEEQAGVGAAPQQQAVPAPVVQLASVPAEQGQLQVASAPGSPNGNLVRARRRSQQRLS